MPAIHLMHEAAGRCTPSMISSMAGLRRFILAVVLCHACVVVWHLVVVANIGSVALTPGFSLVLGVINLLPFVAIALPSARFGRLCGWLLLIPFGIALTAGLISHFLSPGPDSVFASVQDPGRGRTASVQSSWSCWRRLDAGWRRLY